jgi:predicted Zn-dependent peptidase
MTRLRTLCVFACAALFAGSVFAQGMTLPETQRIELDNGAVFVLHEKHDVPIIGLEAIVRGGAVTDPDGRAGMASLLAGLLEKGAGERDAAAFAETIDSVGGSLSAGADLESISISGEFLARDADLMIDLLVDMLRSPTLAAGEMTKLRDRRINLIRAAKDSDPRRLTPAYGSAFLFGEHPYGTAINGDETSLAKITHRGLRGYYADYFGSDRLIIAVAGDFDAVAMSEKLTAAFSDWQPATAPLPEIEAPLANDGRRILLVDKPGATQTYFWIGNVGVAVSYPQRAELDIANTLFGGRFTSLLMDEMRTKAGLTYGARSSLLRPSQPGYVAMVSYTAAETTVAAIDLALELLMRMQEQGFDDEMISSGKNYILGQFPPDLETASQLAGQFAELEALGLDDSFINDYGEAIATADGEAIRSVIGDVYPSPDNLVFVILGDAQLIREDIARYGPITELSITEPRFQPEGR